jgi:hypothetical protein
MDERTQRVSDLLHEAGEVHYGRLDGDWRDVLVVERLVGEAAG